MENFYCYENCKLMLLENVNVEAGLVNGACGIFKGACFSENDLRAKTYKKPQAICIDFGSCKAPILFDKTVPVVPKFEMFYGRHGAIRQQTFPLCNANGITILKAQGKGFHKIMINVEKMHDTAIYYVAFSRVSSLQDICLVGELYSTSLFPKTIAAKAQRDNEMKRLNELIKQTNKYFSEQ